MIVTAAPIFHDAYLRRFFFGDLFLLLLAGGFPRPDDFDRSRDDFARRLVRGDSRLPVERPLSSRNCNSRRSVST